MSRRGWSSWILTATILSLGTIQAAEQKSEIVVEVKYVVLAHDVAAQLKQMRLLGGSKTGKDIVYLSDREMRHLLEVLQSDVRSNVMQAPRITMLDGQNSTIECLDKQTISKGATVVQTDRGIALSALQETVELGVKLNLRSKISADRRSVRVELDTQMTNLGEDEPARFTIQMSKKSADGKAGSVVNIKQPRVEKIEVGRTLNIPDGKSAVLPAGMKICQVSERVCPECLKEIPLLRDLFYTTETHPEVHHLFVMVTPRIVAPREKQDKRTQKKSAKKVSTRPDCCDFRTPIYPPVSQCGEMDRAEPDRSRVLRAMGPPVAVRGIFETTRDDIHIVSERIVDKIDPPRFYPLVGPAQFHHCHWKCTVSCREIVTGSYPFAFRWSRPIVHVVYLDTDHLHSVASDTEPKK